MSTTNVLNNSHYCGVACSLLHNVLIAIDHRSIVDSLVLEVDSDDTTHAVAAAFKKFFRDMPEPLVTFAAVDEFLKVPSMPSNSAGCNGCSHCVAWRLAHWRND
jgi:hypothetical protein